MNEIRAIVKTGQLSDPEAEEYLIQTLIMRRDKVGHYWLSRLSSFDHFSMVEGRLEFNHVASQCAFATRPDSRISWYPVKPAAGTRRSINAADSPKTDGYFLAQIESAEGKID